MFVPHRILIAAAALAVGTLGAGDAGAQAVPGNWHLTWSDEFNVGASDLAGWTYETGNNGGWGNNEKETYTTSPSNSYVSGGALHIAAIVKSSGPQQYTSARIKSNNLFSQAYGLIEFRAKLPAGQGLWPALWMMPKDSAYGGWPTSGEIDVLESKGQDTTLVQGSLHTGASSGTQYTQTRKFGDTGLEPAGFSTTDWHTYDLQWTAGATPAQAGSFTWYVDGVPYYTQTGGWVVPPGAADKDAPFDKPFYIVMNLAVGGTYVNNLTPPPGTYEMLVDYVRAYRITGDATGDGLVNSADLAVLLANYNKAVTGGYAAGDFNGDGRVDADDLVIYDRTIAANAVPPPRSPDGVDLTVPEPSAVAAVCLVANVLMMSRRRRRRHPLRRAADAPFPHHAQARSSVVA